MKNLFSSKLKLKKQTLAVLDKKELNTIIGGLDTVKAKADSIAAAELTPSDTLKNADTLKNSDTLKTV